MVKILQHIPGCLLNFVAGEHHVHALVDRPLHLYGENSGVSVKVLCLALEAVETVCILQIKLGNTSHGRFSFLLFFGKYPLIYLCGDNRTLALCLL